MCAIKILEMDSARYQFLMGKRQEIAAKREKEDAQLAAASKEEDENFEEVRKANSLASRPSCRDLKRNIKPRER